MAQARRGGQRRSSTRSTPAAASGFGPVFAGDDSVIPGEVLLTLSADAADAMTGSVPLHPAGPMGSRAMALGVSDLDDVLGELGAYDITRLAPSRTGMADAVGIANLSGLMEVEEDPLSRSFRVRIDVSHDVTEAADRLAAVATVIAAEPNRWREASIVPDDPQFASQWGLTAIHAPAAWDTTTGSPSVIVAVVDSGCDLDHPELAPLLMPGYDMVDLGPNPTPQDGWRFEGDFAGRDDTPEDEVGHGTHVSGTIACLSNNATAVAGVGWQTRIMPVKALTRMVRISDGRVTGVGSAADIAAALRWATDHGAHVINMSLGSSGATTVEADAIAYAVGKGVVVVAAMGNDGTSNPSYPAAYPGVVAVGAVDSADHRASFSQTGPHISVAAPGVGILSTYLAGGTTTMSGTSMATPHVAGVAALIKAAKPSATGAEIADVLRSTARALTDNPGDALPNDAYGHGCVDAAAAVAAVTAAEAAGVNVATTVLTPHLRSIRINECQPVSPFLQGCGVVKSVVINECVPHSLFGNCLPTTVFEPQCIPVRSPVCTVPTTFPPTTPETVRTGRFGPNVGGAAVQPGYDPYGLMGQAPGAAAPAAPAPAVQPEAGRPEETFAAGYAAGYAAALAQVQQAQVQQAAAAQAQVQAQVAFRRFPVTQPHSVNGLCGIPTVTTPECTLAPITIAGYDCPPLTTQCRPPYTTPGVCPYPPDTRFGYDPYGQSPFGG